MCLLASWPAKLRVAYRQNFVSCMSNALRSAGSAGVVCLNAKLDGWLACTEAYDPLAVHVCAF